MKHITENKFTGNSLCCLLNPLASCTKCNWTICTKCWDAYSEVAPPPLDDAFSSCSIDAVHNACMKRKCYMKRDCHRGEDFKRTDYED